MVIKTEERKSIKTAVTKHPCKVALLIGAGASKPFGMPLMGDFFDDMFYGINYKIFNVDYLNDLKQAYEKKDLYYIYIIGHFLNGTFGNEKEVNWDLEKIVTGANWLGGIVEDENYRIQSALYHLGLLHLGFAEDDIGKLADFVKEYPGLLNSFLLNAITNAFTITAGYGLGDKIREDYGGLLDVVGRESGCPSILFTTNYDLIIEKNVYRYEYDNYFDGFDMNGGRYRTFRLSHIINYFNDDGFLYSPSIFKLHGSLNWKREGQDTIRIEEELKPEESRDIECVLPVLGKGIEEYENPIFSYQYAVFECFLTKKDTEVLVVIGSSLRDKPITDIIERTLTLKENFKLVIVSKELAKAAANQRGFRDLVKGGYITAELERVISNSQYNISFIPYYFDKEQKDLLEELEKEILEVL